MASVFDFFCKFPIGLVSGVELQFLTVSRFKGFNVIDRLSGRTTIRACFGAGLIPDTRISLSAFSQRGIVPVMITQQDLPGVVLDALGPVSIRILRKLPIIGMPQPVVLAPESPFRIRSVVFPTITTINLHRIAVVIVERIPLLVVARKIIYRIISRTRCPMIRPITTRTRTLIRMTMIIHTINPVATPVTGMLTPGGVFIRVGMLVPSRVLVRAGMLGQRPARELLVHLEDRVLRPPRVRHPRASDPGHQHLDRNRLQPPPAPQHPRSDSPSDLRTPRPSPRPTRPLNRCPPNRVNPIKTLPVEQQREAAQRGNRR